MTKKKAKIYKPTKTSMQSGIGKTKKWIFEYIDDSISINPLMGWESSTNTLSELKLFFDTKDQAIEWAKKNNYQYFIEEPKSKKIKPKNYASNFDINRKESWTH